MMLLGTKISWTLFSLRKFRHQQCYLLPKFLHRFCLRRFEVTASFCPRQFLAPAMLLMRKFLASAMLLLRQFLTPTLLWSRKFLPLLLDVNIRYFCFALAAENRCCCRGDSCPLLRASASCLQKGSRIVKICAVYLPLMPDNAASRTENARLREGPGIQDIAFGCIL